ncbi:magnesium-translocating P-type ATPase [Aquella oligotrophica]|uniref:Magnesium-transporting ATPase, P-type 1 n=1 Tax=Aquella oligotrophica TaxID=2067065 RepID=A0A2I7N5N4_9NEIS|nr:magnesium-translocating P-type ATPase [Aquella oligotrophica]AUR51759.1 magnesium-translocating P-type ATPase [Aquella oligotrophica]
MKFVSVLKKKVLSFFDNRFTNRRQFHGDANHLDEEYPVDLNQAPATITQNLITFSYLSNAEALLTLGSDLGGLTPYEVEYKLSQFGHNEIDKQEELSWYKHLWLSYKNPFNLLLTLLAIVSFFTDDMKGATVISSMVVISTILRFVQERRSNNAADKLKEMVSTTATVIRQEDDDEEDDEHIAELEKQIMASNPAQMENRVEVPIKNLVPGDVITLSAGDMIPADVRILTAKDLFISQAALTGESLPVEKFAAQSKENIKDVLELENIAYMGTNVVSGSALAVVLTTGKNTFFGSLADKVIAEDAAETSFQKGVNRVSWLLIYFMLIMSPIVFLINGISTHAWRDAALFSLSIAVGLTPEMLPMIVTSTLAKGAVFMSRRKVIVKRLDAIQNFGAMDILCTDKTGTLTQDKICLEKHTDIFGDDYDDVLEYAYLNSYYQTGLKNLLDVAVLERANFGDIPLLVKKYSKVDEVPFDFQRRRMSVVVADTTGGNLLICKGAVEEMLTCCTHAEHDGQVMPLTNELLNKLRSVTAELNADGLRVVAVAKKNYPEAKGNYSVNDEKEMILVGYVAFLDPPKETTQPAIEALNRLGIAVKILTGDNELVTAKVCREVGLDVEGLLLGSDIDNLSDGELTVIAKNTTVFAKLTPSHKERIVDILRASGHVVGFMGDGINDAPALRAADIGISVDTAVDIAKEAADIILLEKSLMVLEQGVEEGRKTFANMLKYIKMTASSNFGNAFSVLIASAFIPFLPMLPVQLLLQNLIYDISQTVIPFDNVDREFVMQPQRWDPVDLRRFMIFFGPISSLFDVLTFFVLWHFFGANSPDHQSLFQSGWFLEGLLTQTLIVHMIRTRKIPFLQSTAAWPILLMTTCAVALGIIIPMSSIAHMVGMQALPGSYFVFLVLAIAGYMILTQSLKGVYVRKYGWQ